MNNNSNNEPKDVTILPGELHLPGLDGVACGSTRAVPLPHPHTYGKLVQAVTGTFSIDNPLICAPFPCSQSKLYCHCCLLAGKGASGYTVSTYSQNHGSKCRHYSQFMEWYCNYLVCNKLKPPTEFAIPVDYKYLLEFAAVHPINLPAAAAKPSTTVTEAAGDEEASLPCGSNSRAQAVGGGVKSDGMVSGSTNNLGKSLSPHFLSQLNTRVGLYVGELVKEELNKTTVDNPEESEEENPEESDVEVTTANPAADEHELDSEREPELNGNGSGSESGSESGSDSGSQSDSDSKDSILDDVVEDDVVEDVSPKIIVTRMTTRSGK